MKATIPASSYCDETVFHQEHERIFSRAWTFVGQKSALPDDNAWITARVANESVVIQNFRGQIRCFINVCSHRFCEIRLESEGKGPLRCPYHGWTYDCDGIPAGIPHRPRFDNLCPADLALTRYRVDFCGDLIFVNRSEQSSGLRDSMGSFFEEIESLSTGLAAPVDTSEWSIECNWKILVENTLEAYHVGFVHPATFAKLKADFGDFRFDSDSSSFLGRTDMASAGVRKFVTHFPGRSRDTEGYFHFSMFPAFLMSTSYGVVFSVQQITPLSARRTRMKSWLFHRKADPGTGVNQAMESLMHESASAFNRKVLLEDQHICEAVQRGVAQAGQKTGMLSDEERRVAAFQAVYRQRMGLT